MKLSVLFAVASLGLAACAHSQTRAPAVSSTSLTSASIERVGPEAPQAPAWTEPIVPLDEWASRFPDAARLLGAWVQAHRATASALAQWEREEPVKMMTLIEWSVTDVDDPISVLLMDRWGWDGLRAIADRDPAGISAFLTWTRNAPTAATNFDWQPGALTFALENASALTRMNPEREMAKHAEPLTWTTTREMGIPHE
jgi:hypothetical protein